MTLLDEEIKCLEDWANGKKAKPSRIQLEPTFKCNLNCVYCGRHLKQFDYSSELSDEKWKEIAKSVVNIGFRSVILSGEGEVFSEPKRTLMLIKYFKEHDIDGSIISNGTLLYENIIKTLVELGWNDLVISVDGSNPKLHDSLSGIKGSFEKVKNNLTLLKKYKKKFKSKLPELCFITVVTSKNYKDFPNIVKFANKVGCWKITFMPLFNSSNIPYHKKLMLTNNDVSKLVEVMQKVKELSKEFNIQTNADHVLERKEEFSNQTHDNLDMKIGKTNKKYENKKVVESKQKPWEPCYQPWLTMTLGADGVCRACCFLHNIVDSVQDKTLDEVWLGPVFNKLREQVYNKGSVPGCEGCAEPVILRNKELEAELKRRKLSPLKFKEYENGS
jgi:MoaA/NifB/PqqE/SkfB family radical SAM enzyme